MPLQISKLTGWIVWIASTALTGLLAPYLVKSPWMIYPALALYGAFSYVVIRASGDIAYEMKLESEIEDLKSRLGESED